MPERPSGPQALTAAQTRDVHYRYDLSNLQLSARFDSQAGEGITNAYDGFGRLVSTSTDMGAVTRTLGYGYDANGNRIRITHPDANAFVTWYDGLNRPYYVQANGLTGLAYNGFTPGGALSYTGRPGTAAVHGYDGVQRPVSRAPVPGRDRQRRLELRLQLRGSDRLGLARQRRLANVPDTPNGLNRVTATGGRASATTIAAMPRPASRARP